jgi:UDP-N-acetylmuramoylalanine--D-glutamate ligase
VIGSALVVGLGESGRAAAEALAGRGTRVRVVDRSSDVDPGRLAELGVEVVLGSEDEALVDDMNVLVKSPGVPAESPPVARARARGVPVWSEIELGYRLLSGNPLAGVTGTKGKTTTVRLLGAMFDAAGRPVRLAGNEHQPLSEAAGEAAEGEWIVCELSSFQLEDVHTLSCDVAVLLNLEPDHLDRHGSFDAYREAKLRVFERAGVTIGPRALELGDVRFSGDDPLPAEPRIPGVHNRENAAAATAAARAAGIGDEAIAEALRTFPGVAHRLELVRELDGVRYVNDSKATNVTAALRALQTYADDPVQLILGGSPKGEDFAPLAAAIGPNVRAVHLIGEEGPKIGELVDGHADETLERAVAHAHELAQPDDVVLLSPACASYDQFLNFEERGETFRRLVEEL